MQLYIHIPFCMKKCEYCDFLSAAYDKDMRIEYTKALCNEIEFFGEKYKDTPIETVFIGGGTPSWLEPELMAEVMETVNKCFKVDMQAEISMEINPGTVSNDSLKSYISWGLNRISIGLQSANDDELKLLGRVHNYKRFLKTYENARRVGFYNINVDIMTALPYQTVEKLENTLKHVTTLRPSHISAYSLQIEEGTPFYEKYKFDAVKQHAGMPTEALPNEDEAYRLSKLAEYFLNEHGYHRYEISNYSMPDMECIHNIGYWTRKPYLGVGIGAASLIGHTRYTNEKDIFSYINHCKALPSPEDDSPMWESVTELSKKDEMAEFMYLGLRMTEGILRDEFKAAFGQDIEVYYGNEIENLRQQGFLITDSGRIALTERGMDVSNIVLAEFV